MSSAAPVDVWETGVPSEHAASSHRTHANIPVRAKHLWYVSEAGATGGGQWGRGNVLCSRIRVCTHHILARHTLLGETARRM